LPFSIIQYAENIYGPSAANLRLDEKLYLSILLITQKNELSSQINPIETEIPMEIEMGESPISVINKLTELGLISNPEAFRNYLVFTGLDTKIQAGEYKLSPNMTPIEIALTLQDPTPWQAEFTILAGWRSEEIAVSLQFSGLEFTSEDFLAVVREEKAEGYLFPSFYTVPRDISPEAIVHLMVNHFFSAITSEMETGFNQNGLSTHDAIILASIIERESIVEDEMALIASVFINRLSVGMKLDADPTVQYALGYDQTTESWWTNPLRSVHLNLDSPYNTYIYPGLPPGPICNPGGNALRAVAFPAKTPYFYFRAACDNTGRHLFAETFEEHQRNFCR
jgi:UPF0755 protein